jgi:rhodanese-related sulfurtransferase
MRSSAAFFFSGRLSVNVTTPSDRSTIKVSIARDTSHEFIRDNGRVPAPQQIDGVPQVNPQDIDGAAFLLDVREPDEWTAGHAPGAVHVPLGQLTERYADELPADQPIIAICRVGGRSQRAAVTLRNAGYDVSNLVGGMQAWHEAGKPVVTDDGAPGSVI